MTPPQTEEMTDMAQIIEEEIKAFVRSSPFNRMPASDDPMFDEPMVQFADGDDPLFTEYKSIIDPTHLTPREALAQACGKDPGDFRRLSVISWVLPITGKTRESNRRQAKTPSRLWANTRFYGEKLNDALREHVVKLLAARGSLAAAPPVQPYFKITYQAEGKGHLSNWSERHIAYAAGLGTFSLSDGFITERGIAHRCGSAVTDLALPPTPRTAASMNSNCLFYTGECRACIVRCPAGAITESGHDKVRCRQYMNEDIGYVLKEYDVGIAGCGLCQTRVPCEYRNPAGKRGLQK